MPFGIGIWELLILAVVGLLVFRPKRLPEMGRGLGRGFRELKSGITRAGEAETAAIAEDEARDARELARTRSAR